jgi:hypothetical protein
MDNYKILRDQIFDLLMSFNFTNFVLVIIFDFLISKFFFSL